LHQGDELCVGNGGRGYVNIGGLTGCPHSKIQLDFTAGRIGAM
jgi:hypothetical protein